MKKSIIFVVIFVAFAISLVLLLNLGARTNSYSFWIVLILLPLSGYLAAKTNFTIDD